MNKHTPVVVLAGALSAFCCSSAQATEVISHQQTHQIQSPQNNSTFYYDGDTNLNLQWSALSSAFANLDYEYFLVHHQHAGSSFFERPVTTAVMPTHRGFGSNTFAVRAVYQNPDGTVEYGSYSDSVTVDVQPKVASVVTHTLNTLPAQLYDTQTQNLSIGWAANSDFYGSLNYGYFLLNRNDAEFYRPNSTSQTISSLAPEQEHCFKVRAVYSSQWGAYSNQSCTKVFMDVSGRKTHKIKPINAVYAPSESIHFEIEPSPGYPGQLLETPNFTLFEDGKVIAANIFGYSYTLPAAYTKKSGRHCYQVELTYKGKNSALSDEVCTIREMNKPNLFKAGDMNETAQVNWQGHDACSPPWQWHYEKFQFNTNQVTTAEEEQNKTGAKYISRNAHLVAVSKNMFNNGNSLGSQCAISNTTVDGNTGSSAPLAVSTQALAAIDLNSGANNDNRMLYFKSHACQSGECTNQNRAEISYDPKKREHSQFTDGERHLQPGDEFWYAYRFNIVNGFKKRGQPQDDVQFNGVKISARGSETVVDTVNHMHENDAYFFLSQFNPETLDPYINDDSPNPPSFAITVAPVLTGAKDSDNLYIVDPEQVQLNFRTKYGSQTQSNTYQLGLPETIATGLWYQMKIGLIMDEGNNGKFVAAYRPDVAGAAWKYFTTAAGESRFKGKTLLPGRCDKVYPNGVNVSADVSNGKIFDCATLVNGQWQYTVANHFEMVPKAGMYFNPKLFADNKLGGEQSPASWSYTSGNAIEVLMDDFMAVDQADDQHTTWPAPFETATELKNPLNDTNVSEKEICPTANCL